MLLTISTTRPPATDLGYLLHKRPSRLHSFEVASGVAHVFYAEASPQRCTAVLLLEVDPVNLVRSRGRATQEAFTLGQYVNDRSYAASSLMAVALRRAFSSALGGRSRERPELAQAAIPLEIGVPVLPCRGGPELAQRLFGPLGWRVSAEPIALDQEHPAWGDSPYLALRLEGTLRLQDALNHLYILLPVLDDAKHYWVTDDEIDKLIRAGGGWLGDHPDRELIASRYLAHQRSMAADALARLSSLDDLAAEAEDREGEAQAVAPERALSVAAQRRRVVSEIISTVRHARVLDLGCGEGNLLRELLPDQTINELVGVDVSARMLATAARRLHLEQLSERQSSRIRLLQSSLTYVDARLQGFDVAVLMEVLEHIDAFRLAAVEDSVFAQMHPQTVVVTTPNRDFNSTYVNLDQGVLRHQDHRFEWDRSQFRTWAARMGRTYGYQVRHQEVGEAVPEAGAPTQVAVLSRLAAEATPGGPG